MLHPISIQILYLGDYKQHIAYPPQCREEAVFGQVRGHRVQRALLILSGGVSQGGRRGQSPEEGIQWPQGRGKVLQASLVVFGGGAKLTSRPLGGGGHQCEFICGGRD